MPEVPLGQLVILLFAVGWFAAAAILSLTRLWSETEARRVASKACLYVGIVIAIFVLGWHSQGRGSWLPLQDNFDALIWLGLLLALFVSYTQRTRPLRGLDWFVLPIIVALLIAAAVFGRAKPHEYVDGTWQWVHRLTTSGGAVAFAVAGAVGAMYLIANWRLRHKRRTGLAPGAPPTLGSLERLEHFTRVSVSLGFPLLSLGLLTGFVLALSPHSANRLGPMWYRSPKVWLAFGAWAAYALVLHAPINPSFRGRRAAMLSVIGFVLMVGVLVAVQFMPAAR